MHNKIDISVLDFSKAFDTVPHDGLLSKLKHYGIDEKIWLWIYNFLKNRKQSVVVDGKQSSFIDVVSGVPQCTVLGPLLFLLHINDLPSVVYSKVRLFADDCLIYRNIKNKEDQFSLQRDLNLLENWGNKWGMHFNAAKCNIMRVSRTRDPKLFNYSLTGQVLGVTLSNDLEWSKHIATMTNKANSKLSCLRRYLKGCPEKLKQTAYFSLIHSFWSMSPLFGTHTKNTTVTKLRGCSVELQGSSKVGIRDTLVFLICLTCWGGRLFLKGDRRLDLFCFTKLLTVWHKCPSKASLSRRIRVLEENTA